MSVKLVLLKSGENIVSEIKEGYYEEKLICYILEKPCSITINGTYRILDEEDLGEDKNKVSVSLNSWPPLSNQSTVELSPDCVVTIVEPIDRLKKMYETQVLSIGENDNDQSISTNEQSDSDQSN